MISFRRVEQFQSPPSICVRRWSPSIELWRKNGGIIKRGPVDIELVFVRLIFVGGLENSIDLLSRQCEDTDSIPVKAVESFQCYYTSCQENLNCKRFESCYTKTL